jgi:hypothetical protein
MVEEQDARVSAFQTNPISSSVSFEKVTLLMDNSSIVAFERATLLMNAAESES